MTKLDKKIIILSIIIVLLLIASRIFFAPLAGGDEFTNYYNALKIFSGEKIYKDVNIITTPFVFIVIGCFFKIFGTKFIVSRICNFVINILFFFLLYITFKNLKISKKSSFIYSLILEIPIISYVTLWGVTYNFVAIILILIGLNLNLKRNEVKLFNFWQGLIIFLILFTKQNIGIYYLISQILIEFFIEKKWKIFTNLIKQFLITGVGILLFLLFLISNNLLESFIDLTVLGLSTFVSNYMFEPIVPFITVGAIITISILIYMKKYDNKENIIILSILGIIMLFIAFPIADDWHSIIASLVLYIELIYILDSNKVKLESNKVILGIDIYFIVFILLNLILSVSYSNKDIIRFDLNKESPFYLVSLREPKKFENIRKFIEDKNGKVLIISPEAGIFNLYNNLGTHEFFDMPYNGNLGTNQLEKMIKKLEKYKDYYILLFSVQRYQEIYEFKSYIENNYNKISQIEDYTIYKK